MALNLNKDGGDKKSNLQPEKKGFNLSKSDDNDATGKLNLSKDKTASDASSSNTANQNDEKKKSSLIYIVAAIVVLALGGFWFFNQNDSTDGVSVSPTTTAPVDSVASVTDNPTPIVSQTDSVNNITEGADSKSLNDNPQNGSENTSGNSTSTADAPQQQGSIEDKARQVIDGVYGNGVDRKKSLGNDYNAIQAKVNELYRNGKQ